MTITLGTFEIICAACFVIFFIAFIILNIRRENERQYWYERAKREQNKITIYADNLWELFARGRIAIMYSPHIYEIAISSSLRLLSKKDIDDLIKKFEKWMKEKHQYNELEE